MFNNYKYHSSTSQENKSIFLEKEVRDLWKACDLGKVCDLGEVCDLCEVCDLPPSLRFNQPIKPIRHLIS